MLEGFIAFARTTFQSEEKVPRMWALFFIEKTDQGVVALGVAQLHTDTVSQALVRTQ